MHLHRSMRFLPLALLGLLAACGEDLVAPDPQPDPDPREILTAPSFATNINEIIERRGCNSTNCHGAAGGRRGLMLTSAAAANYAMLVNVPSEWDPAIDRVIPNNADGSFLVIKLENRQPASQGGQMPLNGAALDNIDLTNIKNWINNGAPNN